MRVLLLTVVVLAAGSQAKPLTDLGEAFKTNINSLVDASKQVAQGLLDELKVTGGQLASQELQSLMLTLANALSKTDATNTKRQLDSSIHLTDPDGTLFAHADELKGYMHTALNAANRLDHPEDYKNTIQNFLDEIDRIVASHPATTTPAFKKRQLDSSIHLTDPDGTLFAHADELKGYMHTALNAANRLDHPEDYKNTIQNFLDEIDRIVASHPATTTPAFKKRQLDSSIHLTDPDGTLFAHADELKGYMHTALNAANRLDHPEDYKNTIQNFLDEIDRIVANHPDTTTPAF